MTDFRITFSKTGPLVFISHLDLTHTFVRAFNRAEIPLRYSGGFNPHPKLVFALPLSVGMAGENEMCDAGLENDMDINEFAAKIKAALPPYLEIKSVCAPDKKFREVKSAHYRYTVKNTQVKAESVLSFLENGDITVTKKTKSGEKTVNIKPQIFFADVRKNGNDLELLFNVDASPDGYLNPEYIIRALENAGVLPENADVSAVRTEIVI